LAVRRPGNIFPGSNQRATELPVTD
jgi:hypothetical protein